MQKVALARQFADWGLSYRLGQEPAEVRRTARRAIFDALGVMAAGFAHPKIKTLAKNLKPGDGPCSTHGHQKCDSETAALLNGAASHVWDFDDTSYTGIMHGSAVVFPTVLAMAEETSASQEDFLAAFIVGSEITYTLADVCTHEHYFRGWWSTVTIGLIGATLAAARLLCLSPEQASQAVGMAAAAAGGGKSVFGTDAKAFLVGTTARQALTYAHAAQWGLSGPVNAFEDPRGFFALLADRKAKWAEAKSLGKRWRLAEPGLLFKTSPVCSAAQAAIEQMSVLMSDVGLVPEEIAAIKAEVPELVHLSLVYPNPKSPQEAQFSLTYALACAALHGRVRLTDLDESEIHCPRKAAIMEKVEVQIAPDLSTLEMREKHPEGARLIIEVVGGKRYQGYCGEAYGMPKRPLSNQDLTEKFNHCLEFAKILPSPEFTVNGDLLDLSRKVVQAGQTYH
ncbi:MAG: MmgE/PrpD family protein [Pseudomonadota bacterium]